MSPFHSLYLSSEPNKIMSWGLTICHSLSLSLSELFLCRSLSYVFLILSELCLSLSLSLVGSRVKPPRPGSCWTYYGPAGLSISLSLTLSLICRNKIFNIFSSYILTISLALHALLINSERGNIQRADLDMEDGVLLLLMMRSDQD